MKLHDQQKRFTRGQLAAATGINGETIRYYEKIGLLPPPPRSDGGHRVYGAEHLRLLRFIRRARELGFSLDEIRQMLSLSGDRGYNCAEVATIAERHLQATLSRIEDLQKIAAVLGGLLHQCQSAPQDDAPGCGIIDTLFSD